MTIVRDKAGPMCKGPPTGGLCPALSRVFTFDPVSKTCKKVDGCRLTNNAFDTLEECEAKCSKFDLPHSFSRQQSWYYAIKFKQLIYYTKLTLLEPKTRAAKGFCRTSSDCSPFEMCCYRTCVPAGTPCRPTNELTKNASGMDVGLI